FSRATETIGLIGPPALPQLLKALKAKRPQLRAHAIAALPHFKTSSLDIVSPIVDALNDKDVSVRQQAASAIGMLGPAAKNAVLPLANALGDRETDSGPNRLAVSHYAACSLRDLGSLAKPAIPSLIECLRNGDPMLKVYAMDALSHMSPDAS